MSIPGRITHNMMSQHLLTDMRRASSDSARTMAQVTSQRQILSAADDPTGAQRALRLRAELEENSVNKTGVDATTGWTSTSESALSSVTNVIHRVRELVVQAGNDTLGTMDRAGTAKELAQLLEQVKADANAKFADQYVFGGQATTTPPYASGASDAYAGDTGAITRQIGPGQTLQVNVNGADVFGGAAGDGKLLDTIRSAITALNGNTPADLANLRGNVLSGLNRNLDTVLTARSTIGTAQHRAELAESRLADVKLAVTTQLSGIEDVDMAEALTRLSSQQTAYQAALSAGAKVIQPSLMDFLR